MPVTITYSQVGEHFLPDLALSDPKGAEPLSKYGRMRQAFLKKHRPIHYNQLLLTEKLYPHLRDVQHVAQERLDKIISQFIQRNPPPDKATDPMGWVAHMNSLHHAAEEVILSELVHE